MKLNRYNNFLLESAFYDLLLESKLKYMSKFTLILLDIKEDTTQDRHVRDLASLLLTMSNKEMKLTQNFIDIDKGDKVSFIPDNKAIINNEFVSLTVGTDGSLTGIVGNHSIINDLKIPKNGLHHPRMESDIPSNKWRVLGEYNGSDVSPSFSRFKLYHLQNATDTNYHVISFDDSLEDKIGNSEYYELPDNVKGSIKIGRFVNRILDIWFNENADKIRMSREDYTPSIIEKFVNVYIAKVMFQQNVFEYFEVVKGEDIRKWYLETNYSVKSGQLGSSCMRYSYTQDYLNIYVDNPKTCQLLIFKDISKEKINGRALLWTDINGKKHMDRVYTVRDSFTNLFKTWATENECGDVYNDDEKIQVEIINKDYMSYPYMDSMCYFKFTNDDEEIYKGPGSDERAYLYSESNNPGRPYYYLQSTSGDFSRKA